MDLLRDPVSYSHSLYPPAPPYCPRAVKNRHSYRARSVPTAVEMVCRTPTARRASYAISLMVLCVELDPQQRVGEPTIDGHHLERGYRGPVRMRDAARNSPEYTVEGLWRYIVECNSFELEEVTTMSQDLLELCP